MSEYLQKGLPSSFRNTPSNSVLWFEEFLKTNKLKPANLLDLGCGRGRNSIYLQKQKFQVSALDLIQENISQIQQMAPEIDARCHDLANPFPFKDQSFDYAIDVFCFKHLTEDKAIQNYLQELKRVLKTGGIYHLSLASTEDGYYGPLLKSSPHPEKQLIIDPISKIPSKLYQRKQIEAIFSDFLLLEFFEKKHLSPMHGKFYPRCILSFIFSKK